MINLDSMFLTNMDGSSKEADRISIQSKQSMKSFKLIEYLKKCDMEKICKNKIKLMSNEKEKEKYEQRINQKRQAILQLIINMQNLLNTTINRIKQQENQYIMKEFESQVKNMHQFIKAQVETLIAQTNKQNFEIINFLKDFIKNEPCIETNHSNNSFSPTKIESIQQISFGQISPLTQTYRKIQIFNQNRAALTQRGSTLSQYRSQYLKIDYEKNQKKELQQVFSKIGLTPPHRKQQYKYYTSKNLECPSSNIKKNLKTHFAQNNNLLLKGKPTKI